MTLLLDQDDVRKALTVESALQATEAIYRELGSGEAVKRPRSQTYLPVESTENPGFRYRFKSQEGGSRGVGVWALRLTSDMAGHAFTAGVKRRRILPVATGERYCGLVILFDIERIEPVAILPDGYIQKMRVAALSALGARHLAPKAPKVLGLFGSGWQASAHLEFLCRLYDFERVMVYSPNAEHRERFVREMSETLSSDIEAADSPQAVVGECDFVQAATAITCGNEVSPLTFPPGLKILIGDWFLTGPSSDPPGVWSERVTRRGFSFSALLCPSAQSCL